MSTNRTIIGDEDKQAADYIANHPAEIQKELDEINAANKANQEYFQDQQRELNRGKNFDPAPVAPAAPPKTVDLTPRFNVDKQGKPVQWDPMNHTPMGPPVNGIVDPSGLAPELWGSSKLVQRLQTAPTFARDPHTHDWDQWLLTLPFEKGDSFYNQALGQERAAALSREQSRGQNVENIKAFQDPSKEQVAANTPPFANDGMSDRQSELADRKGNWQGHIADKYEKVPDVVNAYGQQVKAQDAMNAKGGLRSPTATSQAGSLAADGSTDAVDDPSGLTPTSPSSDAQLAAAKPVDKKTLERSGKVVWLGQVTKNYEGVNYTTDQYMSVDDAYYLPLTGAGKGGWTPQQIAGFQHATKTKVTGAMDAATQTKWAAVVKMMNYYTTAGVKIDPMMAISAVARTSGGGGGGGGGGRRGRGGGGRGGGGGGGGSALVPADQAKYLLNQTMQKFAGREATSAEFSSFLGQIKSAAGNPDFDGTEFATDWVKSALPQQVGSFQAATDYYGVVQQLVGGA